MEDQTQTQIEKEYGCAYCELKFDSRGKQNAHVDNIHKQSKTLEYCDGIIRTVVRNTDCCFICICGRSYDYVKNLVRHVKSGCKEIKPSLNSK